MNETAPSAPPSPAGEQPPPDRRRVRMVALAAIAVILIGGLWLAFRSPADLVQGMADADSVNVSAKVTARVAALRVAEGERVEAGQLLFELDSPEVAAKRRQAEAALAAAQAQADKAEAGAREEDIRAAEASWRRAQAGSELARSTFQRLERLHAEGVVTRQRRDEARAAAIDAEQQARAARAQYEQALAGARGEDKEAAQAQVRQAEGAVAEVQAAEDEVHGRAPVAGEVSGRMADVGELVPAGYPIYTLIDLQRVWVAFHLREDQFAGLEVGRRLHGEIPALTLEDVEFEVYYISPVGDFATWRATRQSAGYDIRSFEVRARPVAPIAGFRPGMSVLFAWPQR
ncbi:HlyD family secretion protein [Luteimonas sp. JM171]|uniref:HlyD family secretion protein n=1 Tax=Luteimonas sp. JM171 TaxID=1896164 RepID=UPI0008580419|nr:efflux RND transporter periplasmic adaptor subunit [Luteimonas sp. JM171]AOH34952.1 hemolysin secretion protein D [Luteimonas sp. JM171]